MAEEKKKKVSIPGLLAGSGAAIASMLIGSAFGLKGTIYGAAAGSAVYAVSAAFLENHLLKGKDRLKDTFSPSDEDATSLIPLVKIKRSQRKPVLAVSAVIMFLVSAGAAYGVLGVVKGASGTTLGNYAPSEPQPAPAETQAPDDTSPAPVFSSHSESFSAPRSHTPSPSPSPSTSSPSPSPVPAFTGTSQ